MTYFSKKTSTVLTAVSIFALFLSAILILFSNQFVDFTYTILSQKVFHREFSIEKWLPSIVSFFLAPAFAVIALNAFIFFKYPKKQKIILLSVLLGIVLFMIVYASYVAAHMHANSDLGSELWLGKICAQNHTFWPLDWYYSTEIRLLNTQFFSMLGFLITDNWNAVKAIQSFCTCAVLFVSMFYLLNQLEIKNDWIRFFACILSVCPCSVIAWHVGAGENYYVPHAIMSFIYISTFIKIIYKQNSSKTQILFYIWAFVSGLSSIRYIMNFVFPFAITMIVLEANDKNRKSDISDFKGFWLKNKSVFLSVLGLFLSGFGYICNNLILRRLWSFSEWNSMSFNNFGDTTFRDIWSGIVRFFGYKEGIAALSPNGAINVIVYVSILMLTFFIIKSFKSIQKQNKIILTYFITTMIFNTFLYINVDYIARYYYPIIIYVIPVLAILLSNSQLSDLKKYFLGVTWGILIFTSTFSTIQNKLTIDENKENYAVTQFLLDNDYDFGYATFGYATIFTYLSNGKIEMGNLKKDNDKGSNPTITPTYKYDTWLTPKHIYSDENHKDKKIFLIVSQEQYNLCKDLRIFETGKLVYQDDKYRVYHYNNHGEFKNGF